MPPTAEEIAAAANGGGGEGAFKWAPDLPADHVELLKSKGFYDDPAKGAHGVVKSYFEANKMISSGNLLPLPAADAKPEAWDQFYSKLRPESPEKYELKAKDAGTNEQVLGFAKKLAHFWGVPVQRVQQGFDMWEQFAQQQNTEFLGKAKTDNDQAVVDLKKNMGAEKYDAAVANSAKAFKVLSEKKDASGRPVISMETMNAIERNMGSFALMEMLAAIGSRIPGEGTPLVPGGGGGGGDPASMTKEQANAEITRLRADEAFTAIYFDAKKEGHKAAVEKMTALYAAANKAT